MGAMSTPSTESWAVASRGERPSFDRALLTRLAREHRTPLYVLDLEHAAARLARLRAAGFDAVRYAQKANPNLALLSRLAREGARVDAVSEGELLRARAAGFAPGAIQITGDAFDHDLATQLAAAPPETDVSVGSLGALEHALELGRRRVVLRVNPGFGAGHHAKVNTGGPRTKHGIWHEDLGLAVEVARRAGARVVGLHLHIGSGATNERLAELLAYTEAALPLLGADLGRVSTGGGLPVPYRPSDTPFDPAPFAQAWRDARDRWSRARGGRRLELEVEPGRYLVAHAGVIVTEVLGVNHTPAYSYLMVDAGFHTLIRPAMYGAYHHVSPLDAARAAEYDLAPFVVAGPLCETSDLLTQARGGEPEPRALPALGRGELLLVHDAGAYGAAMASGYNVRPLPAEVALEGGVARLARAREDVGARIAEELSLTSDAEEAEA